MTAEIVTSGIDLVALAPLMALTTGSRSIVIGLVDGPLALSQSHLSGADIRSVAGTSASCQDAGSSACGHGTFIAGILVGRRDSGAPAICPGCAMVVRPVFAEATVEGVEPSADPAEVAQAVVDCVGAGARLLNLSAAATAPTIAGDGDLGLALDHAARRGALIIAAAGNQATLGSSVITRHPAVVPVTAYDLAGRPTSESTLGHTIARRGIGGPDAATSVGPRGTPSYRRGTSVAAAYVTGAVALLWSLFPAASAGSVQRAVLAAGSRRGVVPPLLNASDAYHRLESTSR